MFGKVNESLVYAVALELSLALAAILLGLFLGVNPREHLVPWWDWQAIARSLVIGTLVNGIGSWDASFFDTADPIDSKARTRR